MGRAGKIQVQVEHKRWGKRQRLSHRRKHENETKIIGTIIKFSCKCLSATRQHVIFTYVSSLSSLFITAPCDYGLLDKLLHDRMAKFRKIILSGTVSRVRVCLSPHLATMGYWINFCMTVWPNSGKSFFQEQCQESEFVYHRTLRLWAIG